jgi:hypothetical protein
VLEVAQGLEARRLELAERDSVKVVGLVPAVAGVVDAPEAIAFTLGDPRRTV